MRALCIFAFTFAAAFIFAGTGSPSGLQEFWDKAIHFVVYGGLAFMLWLGLGKRFALAAFFAVLTLGAADEINQYFTPGRSADFWDFVIDGLGAGTVLVLARRIIA